LSYVKGISLEPTTKKAVAANNTEIILLGQTEITLKIGKLQIPVPCVVSDNVSEALLGFQFFRANHILWDCADGYIIFKEQNETVPLFGLKNPSEQINRILIQDDCIIKSGHEATIPVKIQFLLTP
jgi:hypothetical protein